MTEVTGFDEDGCVAGIRMYSTCPSSTSGPVEQYARQVLEVARWTEECGLAGLLVYTDNALADPWIIAQYILAGTSRIRPLVAVQPAYMHPFTAARIVGTLAQLQHRAVDVNLVAGGGRGLAALGDALDHDERYRRLAEYHAIFRQLLSGRGPVTFSGSYYQLRNTRLKPGLDPALMPRLFVSGSSDVCAALATDLGLTRLAYPNEPSSYGDPGLRPLAGCGVRLGVIAREESDEAWQVAAERFPYDRLGASMHDIVAKQSDAEWYGQISQRISAGEALDVAERPTYWLQPFRINKTLCPYLVGSYEEVGTVLGRYLELGVRTLILDVPQDPNDLLHAQTALRRAVARSAPAA